MNVPGLPPAGMKKSNTAAPIAITSSVTSAPNGHAAPATFGAASFHSSRETHKVTASTNAPVTAHSGQLIRPRLAR
jgi:hypothetical protein